MPEETLFESEDAQSRKEIAAYLRQVAENLEADDPITLRAGHQEVTVTPPSHPTFEVKVEREGPTDGTGELSLEFELEWDEIDGSGDPDAGDESLEIA